LNLEWNNLTSSDIPSLGKVIGHLKQLNNLKINLWGDPIEDYGLNQFFV